MSVNVKCMATSGVKCFCFDISCSAKVVDVVLNIGTTPFVVDTVLVVGVVGVVTLWIIVGPFVAPVFHADLGVVPEIMVRCVSLFEDSVLVSVLLRQKQ